MQGPSLRAPQPAASVSPGDLERQIFSESLHVREGVEVGPSLQETPMPDDI